MTRQSSTASGASGVSSASLQARPVVKEVKNKAKDPLRLAAKTKAVEDLNSCAVTKYVWSETEGRKEGGKGRKKEKKKKTRKKKTKKEKKEKRKRKKQSSVT